MSTYVDSSLGDAKDILSVVPFIWAVLTALLLVPAWRWSSENTVYNLGRSWAALAASVVCAAVSCVVVAVMAPLGMKVAFENEGPVDGILVLYELVTLAVVLLAISSVAMIIKSAVHLRDVLGSS